MKHDIQSHLQSISIRYVFFSPTVPDNRIFGNHAVNPTPSFALLRAVRRRTWDFLNLQCFHLQSLFPVVPGPLSRFVGPFLTSQYSSWWTLLQIEKDSFPVDTGSLSSLLFLSRWFPISVFLLDVSCILYLTDFFSYELQNALYLPPLLLYCTFRQYSTPTETKKMFSISLGSNKNIYLFSFFYKLQFLLPTAIPKRTQHYQP